MNKVLEGTCSINEKQQLFEIVNDSDKEVFLKNIFSKQLYELSDDKVIIDSNIELDRIFKNILFEIKQNDIVLVEMEKVSRRMRLQKILMYGSGIAAIFIVAFLLGNFFAFLGGGITTLNQPEYTYNEIKAPLGSKSEIKLPDGTVVMLNAGSTLKYRNDFNFNNRDLSLVGEALFTVAKNADIPLNVSAGNIVIKAIGTEFNVKAYDEEGIIETTLIEGKVEIMQTGKTEDNGKYLDLEPNQKAIYLKESDTFTLEELKSSDPLEDISVKSIYENILVAPTVDISEVVAWTQGKLIIKGQSLDDLCVDLQRKYNVTFVFNTEEIKKYRFSGVLLDETLEQVMDVIKLTAPIDYKLVGKKVYLSSNADQLENYMKHLK